MALKGIIRDRYQILEEIGRGGFGIAYRAKDLRVGRDVVVKQLHDQFATDDNNPKARRLFEAEWRTLARLSEHPNIVYLIDLLEDEHAFVMQYISGGNLTELIKRRGKLPLLLAVRFMSEVCHGLESAHKLNIVHRDIKPSNILLTGDDHAKISDFGIAHHPHDGRDIDVTVSGSNLGTINYMAPEQARGANRITPSADIYSVGSTLYAAVTGRYYLPFHTVKGEFDYETMAYNFKLVKEREPDRPHRYNAAIGPILEGIILRCLAKDPAARYATIEEVGAALNRVYTMLELERDRDYQEAEVALTQARWGQALKMYDRVLAIDENYAEAVVHRKLARKWLGPEEETKNEEVATKRPKEAVPVAEVPKVNQTSQQLRETIFGKPSSVAEAGENVSEAAAPLQIWPKREVAADSYANSSVVEQSKQLGPFTVFNGNGSNNNGNGKTGNADSSDKLNVLLWTDDRKLPHQLALADPEYSESGPVTEEENRRLAFLGWPWLVGGLIVALLLLGLGAFLLTGTKKNEPVQSANVATATIKLSPTDTTAPVIAATTISPTATVVATATTAPTTLATTAPVSATSLVLATTTLPVTTVAPTATSAPTSTVAPTTEPTSTAAPPAATPDVKAFAAADSVDGNGNPGKTFTAYLPNDYIFMYLLLANPSSFTPNQFNLALYVLPRIPNDKPINSGTPNLNGAGYLVFEQNASDLKLGSYEGIFTFNQQAIGQPIDFRVITLPPTATSVPQPTPTPRPIYTTQPPVYTTVPPTPIKTTVPPTTTVVPTTAITTITTAPPPKTTVPDPTPKPTVGPTTPAPATTTVGGSVVGGGAS